MPENKSKYTVFLDRTGATAANQDLELCKSVAAIFQVFIALLQHLTFHLEQLS